MHDTLYAHSDPESENRSDWQLFTEHANNVADIASTLAAKFGMEAWGHALGVLHDCGKCSDAFQKRLRGDARRVDHATAGARTALEYYGAVGRLMAYAIAGHHSGLPNGIARTQSKSCRDGGRTPLEERLNAEVEPYGRFFDLVDAGDILLPEKSMIGAPLVPERREAGDNDGAAKRFGIYALMRQLYSVLIDADRLDAEQFMNPKAAAMRNRREYATIPELRALLDDHLSEKTEKADDTSVNRARKVVLEDCLDAASEEPGLFSLTVPTGGGKTLSSLAFALKHAETHGMDRVIIAIPFISITEQTAAVLKNIFGATNVLEHHSNYDFDDIDEDEGYAQRLATQNWGAPIIVTTNVQLFESLFANKPSKSRKVHNIANSVIVLDEAQTLPDGLLRPSLAMLEELTLGYGCSIVLCTATQPALDMAWPFGSRVHEIAKHRGSFDAAFGSRVSYEMLGTLEEKDLVERLSTYDRLLCVVGTKAAACSIYRRVVGRAVAASVLSDENQAAAQGFFHLSACMTPAHRSEVLDVIRDRLKRKDRCVVVSTQLVEAGVDLDFPVVYRELAGIDALVQAAGRCNREGTSGAGIVYVFERAIEGERQKTTLWLEKMKDIARSVIKENGDVVAESLVRPFFEIRYQSADLDEKGIFSSLSSRDIVRAEFKNIPFEQVAYDYRIIEDDTVPVFIPRSSEGRKLLAELFDGDELGALAMKLQRHSVSVPRNVLRDCEQTKAFAFVGPFVMLKEDSLSIFYRDDVGLVKPGGRVYQPLF